jgi:hypothetical protein
MKIFCAILLVVAFLIAAEADEIKPQAASALPFTADQIAAIQGFGVRAEKLAQEQRAIDAERKLVQMEFERLVISACDAAGGKGCSADVQAADSSKWRLSVPKEKK